MEQLLDLQAVEGEMSRRRFYDFVSLAWPVVEPSRSFMANWHIEAIADHLQAVSEGKIRKLLITIPPGHAKSLLMSVLWPAWQWILRPQWRVLCSSYDVDLATRDSLRCRRLVESDWYQQTFQPDWKLASDQNEKGWYENDRKGFRMALGVGGKGTGFRGDCLLIDDPLNAKKQHSEPALQEVVFWYDQVMSSRLNDLAQGSIVIVMQRLSERDLAGHVLQRGGFVHLLLPTEFEPERACVTSLGRVDRRREPGELLFPALFPAAVVAEAKQSLGSQGFAAQHQQRPAPAEGEIFKRHWWRFWQPDGEQMPPIRYRDSEGQEHEAVVVTLPREVDELVQSWDCSFKNTSQADFVAGHVWGRIGASVYLLDRMHGRMDFPATLHAVRKLSQKWPAATAKLIEDKANGSAVIQTLGHELPGILAVNPLDGKIARAHSVSPQMEAGNVYLPHPMYHAWVEDFIEEFASFPRGRHDDDVDATTQALVRLSFTRCILEPTEDDDDDTDDVHIPF